MYVHCASIDCVCITRCVCVTTSDITLCVRCMQVLKVLIGLQLACFNASMVESNGPACGLHELQSWFLCSINFYE